MSLAHIAILDDEPDITALLGAYLGSHGYRATELHNGAALLELLQHDLPALVLLDLGLPGEDGLSIARRVREFGNIGLVIVSGRGDAVDKVVGLEIGADDYITKPFDLRELLARVKAVLRRTAGADAATAPVAHEATNGSAPRDSHTFAGFTLELSARRLLDPSGNEIPLTAGEFDLLAVFVQHPGRVLSRDFLLESTRGREASPFDRSVDVLVGRLRKKLGDDLQQPHVLKAVRSAGYLLVATAAPR